MVQINTRKFSGFDYFIGEFVLSIIVILVTIIAVIRSDLAVLFVILNPIIVIVLLYFMFCPSWWNIELYRNKIRLYNNWDIFGSSFYEIDYNQISNVQLQFYNWSGISFRSRPIIGIVSGHNTIEIKGPGITEAEEILKELRSMGIEIETDYNPK